MTDAVRVPDTLEQALDPSWLTRALGQRHPGIEVTNVITRLVDTRISTNARFTIECTGGVPDGMAADLCIKGYFGEEGRPYAHIGEPEARFYEHLAEPIGVRTLRSHYAGADPDTGAGVFITEDIITEGGEFLDALSPYTVDQAAQSLSEFARLHAFGWGLPDSVRASWLAPRIDLYFEQRGQDTIQSNFDGPVGADVAPAARDAGRLAGAMRTLARRPEGPDWTLIHGDAHVGNVFLAPDGSPALVDWQLVQRNFWGIDIGYHVASAISTEDREQSERDLLRHYLDELTARGVQAPSWNEAWSAYRIGTVYGFFMWGITIMVKPEVVRVLLQRLSAAVAAHDGFAAVEAGAS